MPRIKHKTLAKPLIALGLGALMVACTGEKKPTIAEALAAKADEEAEVPASTTKRERPKGLAPPTEAEFKAWDRKDPQGEKHLYKWDKANTAKMMRYWEEISCFREQIKRAGDKAFGAEPGSPTEEQWFQFKRQYVIHVDGWQKRLFANEPRILEKSKFMGHFLEAHELVMNNYAKAYNNADKTALELHDANWDILENKLKKYVKNLGEKWPERDLTDPKQAAAHEKVCAEALAPPDRSGKNKRRRKKKGPI